MKTALSLIRISVLLCLGLVAIVLILSTENSDDAAAWLVQVVIDKSLGVVALLGLIRLYRRWRRVDPWLMAIDRFNESVDAPKL